MFIHKVDGLTDDRKWGIIIESVFCFFINWFYLLDAQRDIQGKASSDLADAGLEGLRLSFYLTSIYDHSIFEVIMIVVLLRVIIIINVILFLIRHLVELYKS